MFTRTIFQICRPGWVSSFALYTKSSKRNRFEIINIYLGNHKVLYILANKIVKLAMTFVIV